MLVLTSREYLPSSQGDYIESWYWSASLVQNIFRWLHPYYPFDFCDSWPVVIPKKITSNHNESTTMLSSIEYWIKVIFRWHVTCTEKKTFRDSGMSEYQLIQSLLYYVVCRNLKKIGTWRSDCWNDRYSSERYDRSFPVKYHHIIYCRFSQ